MKKILLCAGSLILSFACVSAAYAGAIDNKTNWSAEYIRTFNRNAATDYADIAAYNPAGTIKLHEGFTLNGSLQYVTKEYENNITLGPGVVYNFDSDEPSYIPGLFAVYNKKQFSIFGALTNVGGGGKVDFSRGNATTFRIASSLLGGLPLCGGAQCTNVGTQQLTAESFYLAYTLGAAYALNDMFSFSVGLRYVNANREAQGSAMIWDAGYANSYTAKVSYEQEGDGWGGIFGVNLAPNEKVNIGLRYETKTSLDLEASVPSWVDQVSRGILASQGIINGVENPRDLPAIFAFGISYWLNPKIRVETDYTHYFNEGADWGGEEDLVDDGFDVGIAFEYLFTDKISGSIGYMYTNLGDPKVMLPENPYLDANTIGGGIAYAFNEQFHTNLSLGNSFYTDETIGPVEYKKNNFFLALGMEYRF